MSGVNKVIIVGNVGADPEIRTLQDGTKVGSFNIATSERWTDKQSGEKRERTEWHRITIWNDGIIKVVDKYVKKGSKLYIEGQLETRKWQDQSGADRYTTEVVLRPFKSQLQLLDTRQQGEGGGSQGRSQGSSGGYGKGDAARQAPPSDENMDDDIPF